MCKNEQDLEFRIQTIRICSLNIGMGFGIENADNEKRKKKNNRRNRTAESRKNRNAGRKGNLLVLGYNGSGHRQTSGDASKNYKRVWTSLVRYSGSFLKWTRKEFQEMDQRTRKQMTIHKALHPRDDIDRLLFYEKKKEEEDTPALKIT